MSRKYVYPAERFAGTETGTGFTLTREAVRDPATTFALLTSFRMTDKGLVVSVICGTARDHLSEACRIGL
jgi:hypothetical protein